MATVVEELTEVTEVEIGEDVQTSLRNIVQAVNGLDDDKWTGLSVEAQNWFNDAAKLVQNGDEDLPFIPGMDMTTPPEPDPEPEIEVPAAKAEATETEATETETTEAEAPKKVSDKPAKEKKEKTPKKPKREGPPVTAIARGVICENLDATYADVQKILDERKVSIAPSSAKVVYLNFQKTIEAIQKADGAKNKDGKVVVQYVA